MTSLSRENEAYFKATGDLSDEDEVDCEEFFLRVKELVDEAGDKSTDPAVRNRIIRTVTQEMPRGRRIADKVKKRMGVILRGEN